MSSTTTYKCDYCPFEITDPQFGEYIDSINIHGTHGHTCTRCWKRAVAGLRKIPDPTPAEDIEKAVAEVTAKCEARIANLINAHVEATEKHNEERERRHAERADMEREHASHVANIEHASNYEIQRVEERFRTLQADYELAFKRLVSEEKLHETTCAKLDEVTRRSAELDTALAEERTAHAHTKHELGDHVALAVELRGLIGKKKAHKHAERLAQIDALLSTYLGG